MKLALSNLLGEYVDAASVEHGDIAGFQIVCPCCREAVFKVVRTAGPGTSEFFSHRVAKPGTEECEKRVARIGESMRWTHDAQARGQTLKAFRSVLRQATFLDLYPYRKEAPSTCHARMSKLPGIGPLTRCIARRLRDIDIPTNFDTFSDSIMAQMRSLGWEYTTGYSMNVQRSISKDILLHLATAQGERSRDHLVVHALALLKRRRELGAIIPEWDTSGRHNVYDILDHSLLCDGHRAYSGLSPFFDMKLKGHDKTLWDRFEEHVIGAMTHTLLRLPYKQMLENHSRGLSPVADLVPEHGMSMRLADGRDVSASRLGLM